MFLSRVNIFLAVCLFFSTPLAVPTIGAVAAVSSQSPASRDDARDAGWPELAASMETMHHAMAEVHRSQESDLNFVNLMLPHHQAAIDMAKVQLKNGRDPQIRRLAQEIITDQQSEIELMRLWLKQHDSLTNHQPR